MTPATDKTIDLIINMLLYCPNCNKQHIDKDKPEQQWINRPHKSHRCDYCTWIWRPSDTCTNGVAAIETKGKADLSADPLAIYSVQPHWCKRLTLQMQSVLFLATRGGDGLEKFHPCKDVQRAYRASVMVAAKVGRCLEYGEHADNFMSLQSFADDDTWNNEVDQYFAFVDSIPHHFSMKLTHATEILGYKHPDERFRDKWRNFYFRAANELHFVPEPEGILDARLSDWHRSYWTQDAIELVMTTDKAREFAKQAVKAHATELIQSTMIADGVMPLVDSRTQNGPESEEVEQAAQEKIYDPHSVACGCGYKNMAHPRPQGLEYNQRRLCNGKVITMTGAPF